MTTPLTYELYRSIKDSARSVRSIRAFHMAKEKITFRFFLRPDPLVRRLGVVDPDETLPKEGVRGSTATLVYPMDLTFKQACRLAAQILSLPLDGGSEDSTRMIDQLLALADNKETKRS